MVQHEVRCESLPCSAATLAMSPRAARMSPHIASAFRLDCMIDAKSMLKDSRFWVAAISP